MDEFKYLSSEEYSALDSAGQLKYLAEKRTHEANLRKQEIDKAIEEAQEKNASKEEVEKLQTQLKDTIKELEDLAVNLKASQENGMTPKDGLKTFDSVLTTAFTEKQADLDSVIAGNAKSSVSIKAVVNITDATTIDATGSANHINLTQNTGIISKIRSRILKYLSNVASAKMVGNRVNWVEELDEQGTPIFIAEAATKTKISVRYEEREKKSKKIGVYSKVSTELLRNLPMLVSYIKMNLVKRVDIATEDQLFNGDDTGNNLAGITTYATAFTGGSLAGTVAAPSSADVFRALALQVEEAFGVASAVWVRPSILASMDVEKSADGIYLLPPFRSTNGNMVAGMELIPSNGLPSGFDFIGGDLSVINVRFADEMSVQVEMTGTDFIDNMRTILVEQELVQWVSANDTELLVKGDMATAITALTV